MLREKRVFVVTDERVAAAQWPRLSRGLRDGGIETVLVTVPSGEASKNFAQLEAVLGAVLEKRPERGSTLLALGGGVVGDLTGLAASLLLRGVDFIQAPTTLLAQVDSAVGGKTGINTRHGKNLVGTFHQPRLVLADLDSLASLPRRELLAGYAEIVKYGLVDEPEFFAWLEANGPQARQRRRRLPAPMPSRRAALPRRASSAPTSAKPASARCSISATRSAMRSRRRSGYGAELLHGEAVGIGMVMAFDVSVRLGLRPGGRCGAGAPPSERGRPADAAARPGLGCRSAARADGA